MNKKKATITIIISFLIVVIVSVIYFANHNEKRVQLGDQVALFNRIDEKGKEVESVVEIFNPDLLKKS